MKAMDRDPLGGAYELSCNGWGGGGGGGLRSVQVRDKCEETMLKVVRKIILSVNSTTR